MTEAEMTQWCLDNKQLILSTKAPTREQAEILFMIANAVDKYTTHKASNCGRCVAAAKKAIRTNLRDLFL
jgi:hypothetical protein